jgi:hypothetical protein
MPAVFDALDPGEEACAVLPTTLYDLMSALQDEIEPGEEDLVVRAIVHLLHTGRITFRRAIPELETACATTLPMAHA